MKTKLFLERAAIAIAVVVVTSSAWFWTLQIGDVLETLSLANG